MNPKLKKVPLQSAFEKTTEKYTLSVPKSRPSKSKNIRKTCEGYPKSYFSHLRNDVEKMTLRPLISERFLAPTSAQDREKVVSKSLLKFIRFFIRFLIDFSSILPPLGNPKVIHFSCLFAFLVALAPSWRQEAPKVPLDSPKARFSGIFYDFETILNRF